MTYINTIRDHYCYEPLTGKVFWSKRPSNRVELFSEAGSQNKLGYMVSSLGGKQNLLHRVVLEIILGRKLKKDECVDHINGNKSDNRLSNLRIVDCKTNSRANRIKSVGKTSKYMGVFLEKRRSGKKWIAKITQGNFAKTKHRNSQIESAKAYDEMARDLGWPEERMNFPKKGGQ